MSSLIVCAKIVIYMGITGCGINITLHSLDWHVRDVTQKVHLMSDMVLFPNSSGPPPKKNHSWVSADY